MNNKLVFDAELIRRYDRSGPRYTSYPTAAQFHENIGESDYREWVEYSNEDPIPHPLSLYFHIPFCSTVCYYCACNKIVTKDRSRAIPYLEALMREIEIQGSLFDRDRTVEQLHWGGGTPTFLSPEQMRSLMAKTAEHFSLRDDGGGEYALEIDPRSVDAGTIALLRELGFNRLSLGVQDFDPDVQRAVNRIQGKDETLAVMAAARSEGFRSINVDLIYGLPFQNVARFSNTLETLIEADPDRIAVYNYAHLPKRFPPQRRINAGDLPSAAEKLDILELTIERLGSAGYVYIGMDHFAKPDDELAIAQENGTLHRNFQGYSAHAECETIGMGVSAISCTCRNYSQNTTDIKAYEKALGENRLPIARGYELEPDDILRRSVIHHLMCYFFLDLADIEKFWKINFWSHFAAEKPELEAMELDGLLSIQPNRIEVQPMGRLLVRNICMVFDPYLRGQDKQVGFSRVI